MTIRENFDFDTALAERPDDPGLMGRDGILMPLIKQLTEAAIQVEITAPSNFYQLRDTTGRLVMVFSSFRQNCRFRAEFPLIPTVQFFRTTSIAGRKSQAVRGMAQRRSFLLLNGQKS